MFELDKQILRSVCIRTLYAIIAAIFFTTLVVMGLTAYGYYPRHTMWSEILEGAFVATVVASAVGPIISWPVFKVIHELDAAKTELAILSERDFLTKLYNRRGLKAKADALIQNAKTEQHPVSMMVVDIDNFKLINDTHGHQAGDAVICAAAKAITDVIEASDATEVYAGRIGGEEYAILLRGLTRKPLSALVETLRLACEHDVAAFDDIDIPFTVSIGSTVCSHADADFESLNITADRALYRAKKDGRNRCNFVKFDESKAAA